MLLAKLLYWCNSVFGRFTAHTCVCEQLEPSSPQNHHREALQRWTVAERNQHVTQLRTLRGIRGWQSDFQRLWPHANVRCVPVSTCVSSSVSRSLQSTLPAWPSSPSRGNSTLPTARRLPSCSTLSTHTLRVLWGTHTTDTCGGNIQKVCESE